MSRKTIIGQAVVGVVMILIGYLIFARVVPAAKSIPALQVDTVVGTLLSAAGMICLGNAIAKAFRR